MKRFLLSFVFILLFTSFAFASGMGGPTPWTQNSDGSISTTGVVSAGSLSVRTTELTDCGDGTLCVGGNPVGPTLSCAVLDTAICTSSVDTSGNPNFLGTAANTVLPINGAVTNLVAYIGGVKNTLSSNVTVDLGATSSVQKYILAKQNATGTLAATDFIATTAPPITEYVAPTCPTSPQGVALSVSNPAVWFDLSANATKTCTSNGGSYTLATPMLQLGIANLDATPKIDVVVSEPHRLNPAKRYAEFGNAKAQTGLPLLVTTGTTTIGYINATAQVSITAAGTNYGTGTANISIPSCGAVVGITLSSNHLNGVSSIVSPGNGCKSGIALPTVCQTNCGTTTNDGTLTLSNLVSQEINASSLSVTGGILTSTQTSNGGIQAGIIFNSQNPIIITGTGAISGDGKGIVATNGVVGACTAPSPAGGFGGSGGGGGGSNANGGCAGAARGKGLNWLAADGGAAGTAGNPGGHGAQAFPGQVLATAVSNATVYLVPGDATGYARYLFSSIPFPGLGGNGGAGGGDGSSKGGNAGTGGVAVMLRAPAIYVASTASVTSNGTNGSNGEGGNAGGGGGGAGGVVALQAGYISDTGATETCAGGTGGTGQGSGKDGGVGGGGLFVKTRLW